jgi:peptidyl-dipeptidase Dcp
VPNPLLQPSPHAFDLPDFASIEPDHYLDAVRVGIDQHRDEVRLIRDSVEPPSFDTTVRAFELSGQTLRHVLSTFYSVKPSHGTPEILDVHAAIQRLVTAHQDAILLDGALYDRLAACPTDGLDGEDARLVSETLRRFRQAGADVSQAGRERLRELNAQLSELSTEYSRRMLAGQNAAAVLFSDTEELDGLTAEEIASARNAARDAGHDAGYLITLVLPTGQPVLERLTRSASRRRVFDASIERGLAGEFATLALARDMAMLRAERARLLGFDTHADHVIEDQTAPSVDAVRDRLTTLAERAIANARREHAILEEAAGGPVQPWDWAYWSAQVKRDSYDVDAAALRPWFELERVLEHGVFRAAGKLYGLQFAERFDLSLHHPDARVWDVTDADGSALGLFIGDFFARPTKAGGAWMNAIRVGAHAVDERPIVTNNLNIVRPADGPCLLTLGEVRTLFHEFGHALHGLFSAAAYPSLAGTAVPRDFVEYPSQVNEMWKLWPDIVADYARHHQTGEPLPDGALQRIEDAALWGEGFATTEYLSAALLDLAWHSLTADDTIDDVLDFEDRALRDVGLDPDLVPPRYRTGYFKHIFDGGYAAGYYSYIWSEILDADTVEWFTEQGGLTRENGDTFRHELLSRGNTRDPLASFRALRGRDADLAPLLARRGLTS